MLKKCGNLSSRTFFIFDFNSQAVAIMSRFSTKYSTPEYRVVMAITATHTVLSQPGIGRNMMTMHTMVLAVFTFPGPACGDDPPLVAGDHPQAADGELPHNYNQQRPSRHLPDFHKP